MICDAEPSASSHQRVGAADQIQALADKLDGLCNRVADQVDAADRAIEAADRAIRRAHQLGLCHHQFAIGSIAIRRLYGPDGPSECLELTQAAVTTGFGCVAVTWSSDDYQEWQEAGEPHDGVSKRCAPLRDCSPTVRVALLSHIPDLLRTLLRGVERSLTSE
ncbi:hypothetical protein RSSM_03219 [Rhodopirellula sallentina SM41]|uniref:Uncharacterized protein n=2 Tax=Rhodopirellula TaxID=265488 RepID=M5U1R6_9BACT|nr:hypothetical protein RSSM_03219 [Rhodopirellula sallentina SM41]